MDLKTDQKEFVEGKKPTSKLSDFLIPNGFSTGIAKIFMLIFIELSMQTDF